MNLLRNYLELCKPRVVMLMILTSLVGMCLATTSYIPASIIIYGNLGIALVASAAAVINHFADQEIDRLMLRTRNRPLAKGNISNFNSLIFATVLCVTGLVMLIHYVNTLTAALTFISLIGYAFFYTLFLKKITPQNIVIGGLAGAAPPLLGWTAVTGDISAQALLLVLIIFVWTPPHFWALAIYRLEDYAKADIPMLPNTHGVEHTKLHILLYTILLSCVTLLPYLINMSGVLYLIGVVILNIIFLVKVLRLYQNTDKQHAFATFKYSIYYLGFLFLFLLFDHYLR